MRINRFIAQATGISRRAADRVLEEGRVVVNGQPAVSGQIVEPTDDVRLDGQPIRQRETMTIIFNKPAGYVVSRDGQGSPSIYELLPAEVQHLKPVGRLDKDSSGLLLLTNDGDLAQQSTHPSFQKNKIYEIQLNKPLQPLHHQMIADHGITLDDGSSRFQLDRLHDSDDLHWRVIMHEGRNRQIRRTFYALGYTVIKLHRTQLSNYRLGGLSDGNYTIV